MDIFAHTLWTNVVFYKKMRLEKINRFIAVFFGVLPDFVSFVPIFVYRFFSGEDFFDLIGRNIWVVNYASNSYNYTHSVFIFSLAVLLVALIRFFVHTSKTHDREKVVYSRLIYWPMWGWLLHILIDIPTHKNFYETPFLFPLSGYRFSHGISWGHPTFMIINYGALAAVYLFWFLVLRKKWATKPEKI